MRHGLLYLGADVEQLYRVQGAVLHPVAADTRFAELTVVADFVEESLVRASLPRMFGRDMQALVQRRLEQEFRETAYRDSARLGPSAAPKQVDYLFLGLPIARRLDARLAPLVEQGVAIRGLYTPAMLAAHWARRGKVGEAVRLIVLPTPAGARFILLDRGQAVLSRLTSMLDFDGPQSTQALGEELERTVQYLYNARLVERGQRLDLWLWGSEPACAGLAGRPMVAVQAVPGPVDARLGDPAREGLNCLLRLAALNPPPHQLAPDPIRRLHAVNTLRRGLLAGGAAIGLLLGLLAALTWQDGLKVRREVDALQQQLAGAEAELDTLRERTAAIAADPAAVEATIRAHDRYLRPVPALAPVLRAASRAFDDSPTYRLDFLRWDVIDPPRIDPLTGVASERPGSSCPGDWPADPETGERPQQPRAGLALQGQVLGDAALREVLDTRRRFEALLQATPGFALQTQAAAVDASGSGVLRGGGERAERSFDYCLSATVTP